MAEIYLIYNNNQSITDKYIGSSNDLEKRMANHESSTTPDFRAKPFFEQNRFLDRFSKPL